MEKYEWKEMTSVKFCIEDWQKSEVTKHETLEGGQQWVPAPRVHICSDGSGWVGEGRPKAFL